METVIQTTNLTKFYGKSRGIENVNINVNKGDIYGFLGPNGSGKSTTIRTLLDLIRPTRGSASIFGLDCQKDAVAIKKRIGYVPGDVSLYSFMSAEKFMAYFGGVRGKYDPATARKYADRFDIRLDMLMEEAANGRTIFMSSHVLFEVEKACNRVAIIKDGGIVAQEKVEDLQKKSGRVIDVKFNEQVNPEAFRVEGVSNIIKHNGSLRFTVSGNVRNVLKEIASHDVADISVHQMSLEDIFLQYYSGGK